MVLRRPSTFSRRLPSDSSPHQMVGLIRPPEWTESSPCSSTDPDIFHPERGSARNSVAKHLCWDVCTVREQCLEWALSFEAGGQDGIASSKAFGIWGGLVPSERKKLLQERALAAGDPS